MKIKSGAELVLLYISKWLTLKRPTIQSTGEAIKQREFLYRVAENVKWYNHCEKSVGHFIKKLNKEFPGGNG